MKHGLERLVGLLVLAATGLVCWKLVAAGEWVALWWGLLLLPALVTATRWLDLQARHASKRKALMDEMVMNHESLKEKMAEQN